MPRASSEAGLVEAARFFGVLAEPARLRILQLLRDSSMCGCELAKELKLTPATTCHHLEKLKLANLLSERRAGRRVYYRMKDMELTREIRQSLEALAEENAPPREVHSEEDKRRRLDEEHRR